MSTSQDIEHERVTFLIMVASNKRHAKERNAEKKASARWWTLMYVMLSIPVIIMIGLFIWRLFL